MVISDQELQDALLAVLIGEADPTEPLLEAGDNGESGEGSPVLLDSVISFAEAGVLTYNAGLVLGLSDGAEFQLTIVRSR